MTQSLKYLKSILPEPTYKGRCGKICIIGGSKNYSGAPYYAAMAALRFGADLAHVFCDKEANLAIKSYSPEIITHPVLQDNTMFKKEVKIWFERFSSFVIGPGLGGRDEPERVFEIVKNAVENIPDGKPVVFDADGLWFISEIGHEDTDFINSLKNKTIVFTPNVVEMKRLVNSSFNLDDATIFLKGEIDVISSKGLKTEIISEYGMQRRGGGLGDLLSGSIGAAIGWYVEGENNTKKLHQALEATSIVIRKAQSLAYAKKFRGTLASDVLDEIPIAFHDMILK